MPASGFLLAVSGAARVASLNLCTDEYALLLARPGEIVSVSYLSRDPLESPLWRQARKYRANHGSIEDVLTSRPSLVLTMGGGGRATALLASRLHMRALDLPYATSIAAVEQNLRTVAAALGDGRRADPWVSRIERLRQSAPTRVQDAMWISGRGDTLAPNSLGTEWLRLAGLRQRPLPGGRVTLEALLISPPKVLIRSDYRVSQMSEGARWLDHPAVRRSGAKQLPADGRAWTCMGPLMVDEIARLRAAVQ